MSLNDEERAIVVRMQAEKARKGIAEIPALQELGYYDTALNRLYYALYHAASALLINDGIAVKTHLGINVQLGQVYVAEGKLTPNEGHFYARVQNLRERGDYNCSYNANAELIEELLPRTECLIEKMLSLANV